MSKKYIAIFDSGIGGLTVTKNILENFKNENTIFYGDNQYMPYGNLSKEEIIEHVLSFTSFLNTYDLKAMVIACNTIDSNASDVLRKTYDIPIFGVIEPTCQKAIKTTTNHKIGVLATKAAIKTHRFKETIQKLNPNTEVYEQGCSLLASYIEQGRYLIGDEELKNYIKAHIDPLIQENIDTLILGCTHYDLIDELVQKLYPTIKIISSSKCVVDSLKKDLILENNNQTEHFYFVSSKEKEFEDIGKNIIKNIKVELHKC